MISLLKTPDFLQPVYSIQEFTLYDGSLAGQENLYYQLDISINGEMRYIKQLPDEFNQATIDITKFLWSFFESQVITHRDDLLLDYSTGLFQYSIVGHSKIDASTIDNSVSSGNYFIFNGQDKYNRTWDISTYFPNGDVSTHFLTNWNTQRDIHINDDCYFQFFTGTFNSVDTSVNTLHIRKGTTVTDVSLGFTNVPSLWSLNVCPSILGTYGVSLSEKDSYYVSLNNGVEYKINIIPEDERMDRYYRIYYVGGLGSTEAYNFDLVPSNSVSVKKTIYKNNRYLKSFGTSIEDTYMVTSDWMNQSVSQALKEIWYAPCAELYEPDINLNVPIIITDQSKQIMNRWNNQLINYTLQFIYAEELTIQQQ